MEFRILGPLEVSSEGGILDLGGAKQRALLAILLLDANSVVSKNRLIDALWEGDPPDTAQKALQVHVSGLRKVLGKERVVTREPGYLLRVEEGELDLARFRRLREEGRPADALALWRGAPLSDFSLSRFAQSNIALLEDARLACLEERIDQDLRAGRHAELTGELEGLVSEYPLRERLRVLSMLALYRSGRQAEALAAYQDARRVLVEELGIEPGKPLRDVHQAVLNQDPALDLPAEERVREPEDAAVPAEAVRGQQTFGRRRCGRCGESNPPEARLCFACGAALPGRPREGAERRLVTVLFVDLVGFTQLAERLDPEDLKRVVAPYFERMRSEIERFGGHIEKYVGDAVMALFGAPVAYGDDPERAVRAAFAVRDAVVDLNAAGAEFQLDVRIGVNTDEALVDLAADTAAGRGMASGDVVVTCFRLQQAAPVNGILVGEGTYGATHRLVDYREGESVAAKGKQEPLRGWVATALVDAPGTPRVELVGRKLELDHLRSVVVPPTVEGPRIVTLVGPPGVGKSRLLWELCRDAEGKVLWRQGRSLSYGAGVSFFAFAVIVKSQAGILESDAADVVERRLSAAVAAAIPDESGAEWVEAYLRPLVGLGGAERLSGDRRAEAFSAWRRFLEAVAEQRPLVLALEDVHWADDGLLDFVEHVGDWAQGVPLTVLCTARPELLERRPRWPGVLQLDPLSTDDTGALLDALLGSEWLGPELRAELIARVGGNPLYAEEFARLVKERGARERLRLPETIQATIAGRLDSLHPEARELLHDAAVIGTAFWPGALALLSGLRVEQVERRLGELQWKELIRPLPRTAIADESQYVFWHVLVRDVAYAQIPRAARAEKHRRAAEWIESLAPGRADLAELLAHHHGSALEFARLAHQETGPLEERARLALRNAGEHALTLYAFPAAAGYFRRALELWPAGDPERDRLRFDLGRSLFWAERTGDEELAAAREALLGIGDRARAVQAGVLLTRLARARGDRTATFGAAFAAVEILRDLPPSKEHAEALSNLAAMHAVWGESDEALKVSAQALELAETFGLDEIKAESLTFRGHARILDGERGGLADLEQALEISLALNSPGIVGRSANLATSLVELGELERAWETYETARDAARRFGDAPGLHWLAAERPYELYWRGEWDAALAAAESVLHQPDAGYGGHAGRSVRAWIRLARGDRAGAMDDSARALEFGRQTGEPATLCQSLALRARVLVEAGRTDEAGASVDEVLELFESPSVLGSFWTADLAAALRELGRGGELPASSSSATEWLVAARLVASGRSADAADRYAAMGARPEEAWARLQASAELASAGMRAEAEKQVGHARAFYRAVGGDAYVRAGVSLPAQA
jgi:class 3 adenylate cyclase/DNA-binding SARP family transcriptional activator/tetratricopeptide (TPR) repeat protein